MGGLQVIVNLLGRVNHTVLTFGRRAGCVALGAMVFVVLLQIFFRYVLNSALPWPEEAARAFMIWMMALVAPSAYRHLGFVSIDMLPDLLPRRLRLTLMLAIMGLSFVVFVIMLQQAWAHYSAPLLFDSSGLNRLLQDSGLNQLLGTNIQFRTAYIYLAMSVLMVMLISVLVELILRTAGRLIWSDEDFPSLPMPNSMAGG